MLLMGGLLRLPRKQLRLLPRKPLWLMRLRGLPRGLLRGLLRLLMRGLMRGMPRGMLRGRLSVSNFWRWWDD